MHGAVLSSCSLSLDTLVMIMTENDFHSMRQPFEPTPPKLVVVLESPPQSEKYVHNVNGNTGEPVYREFLRAFDVPFGQTKREGLKALKACGVLLLDATYEPVDGAKSNKKKEEIILRDCEKLVARLDRAVPVVLVKVNVCDLLEPLLVADGFKVLNHGVRIPFPATGNQLQFRGKFAAVIGRERTA